MIPPAADLDALFKRLHLANARRVWRDLVQRAERETWPYRDFLTLLVAEEIAHRQQTRLTRLVRRAHFPFFKTIDDFNFTYQSTVRLNVLGSALSPDFVTDGRSLIFGGKTAHSTTLALGGRCRAEPLVRCHVGCYARPRDVPPGAVRCTRLLAAWSTQPAERRRSPARTTT